MNRRRFSRTLLGAVGASALPFPLSASPFGSGSRRVEGVGWEGVRGEGARGDGLRVDGPRLNRWLQELSRFGARPDGGVDRVAFSDAELAARERVRGLMEGAGLELRVDFAGNLLGWREGSERGLAPLMLGSHLDSVPSGGNYDGSLGTLGAVEVAMTLREADRVTRHPLEVVVFTNEEGGKTGSRALSGELRPHELEQETPSGYTVGEGIRRLGGDPDRLEQLPRTPASVAGFLELHVEQGGALEAAGVRIGVVEGIVGIRRWNAIVRGFANHAGTTPMDQRQDALLGAARLVEAVRRAATSFPGEQVGTVGRIQAFPGAPNVIPGEAALSIELRALEMETIERVFGLIKRAAREIEAATGTTITLEESYESPGAPTDLRFRDWIEGAARELGYSHRRMPSGAGHDAQSVARFAPMGMIFIPSVGGVSHSPREYSRPEDVEAGANVLLHALLRADEELG